MRFYENDIPNVDEIVMCQVDRIQDFCIYVKLLEYDNIEGMVQLADASTRRKRKSVCLLKVNKRYPLLVIRVDRKNKYIDLSNKFLSNEDKDTATERYNNYFFVTKIIKKVLSNKFNNKYEIEEYFNFAKKTIWKIDKKKCYEYLIDNYLNNNNYLDFEISQNEKDNLSSVLKDSLGEVNFITTLNFMARNADFEGINKIKETFSKIKNKFNVDAIINVAPNYYLRTESNSSQNNVNRLNDIEIHLSNYMKEAGRLYKKMDIDTVNSIN